jgi:hypothetical protein
MNEQQWDDAKHDLLRKYYVELYKEDPIETRRKEIKNRHVAKRLVLRRIDICIAVFEKSLKRPLRNRRRRVVLELDPLTVREKFYLENLLVKFVLEGRLSTTWIRNIDLAKSLPELLEEEARS